MFLLPCSCYVSTAAPDPLSHFKEIRKGRGQGSSVSFSKEKETEDCAALLSVSSPSFSFFSLSHIFYPPSYPSPAGTELYPPETPPLASPVPPARAEEGPVSSRTRSAKARVLFG